MRQRYPAALAHALLRLHRGRHVRFIAPDGFASEELLLQRGLAQGDPTSPLSFCLTSQDILQPVLTRWHDVQLQFPVWILERLRARVAFMDDLLG